MTGVEDVGPAPRLRAVLHPAYSRVVTGVLTGVAGASLLAILGLLLLSDRPVNPLRLMRLVAGLCLLPELAVMAIRHWLDATLHIDAGALVLEQRQRRIEIPIASVAALEPWRLPLPGSGLWVRLQSGRRWRDGIEMEDPVALIDALARAGGSPRLRAAARHPGVIYQHARHASRRRSWRRLLLKFPIFALVPTLPLFRVHQIIAYGGALGEYYQYGLGAYLAGFAISWATLTIYLMLYAAALRVPVELLAVASAVVAPQYALGLRRVLDRLSAILYFGSVPTVVALRFVPW